MSLGRWVSRLKDASEMHHASRDICISNISITSSLSLKNNAEYFLKTNVFPWWYPVHNCFTGSTSKFSTGFHDNTYYFSFNDLHYFPIKTLIKAMIKWFCVWRSHTHLFLTHRVRPFFWIKQRSFWQFSIWFSFFYQHKF